MAALEKIADDFSRAAQSYDAHARLQREVLAHLWALVEDHAPRNILDVGAGTGHLAQTIGADYEVTQLDIAPGMCDVAAEYGETICADMHAIPLDDASVDMVFSSLALQWSDAPEQAVNEMLRVLKPGGILAIATLSDGTLAALEQKLRGRVRAFQAIPQAENIDIITHEQQTKNERYNELAELLRTLKGLGAQNKTATRNQPFSASERALITQPHEDEWQVEYLVGCKR